MGWLARPRDRTKKADALRALRPDWPIVPVSMLEKSVENLERIVTTG